MNYNVISVLFFYFSVQCANSMFLASIFSVNNQFLLFSVSTLYSIRVIDTFAFSNHSMNDKNKFRFVHWIVKFVRWFLFSRTMCSVCFFFFSALLVCSMVMAIEFKLFLSGRPSASFRRGRGWRFLSLHSNLLLSFWCYYYSVYSFFWGRCCGFLSK